VYNVTMSIFSNMTNTDGHMIKDKLKSYIGIF
jgi:hypothetical protein